MNINGIFKTELLEKGIDASVMRSEAISQNIANVNTPNYKRKKVSFEEYFTTAQENSITGTRTDPRHIPIGGDLSSGIIPRITEDGTQNKMRLDGNNVDVNNEMSELSKNTLKHSALIQKINGDFKKLKTVISEGRR